ncbi:MAG: hypothetical protein IKD08_01770, partial [Alphaproteobacteria bacterium]|nr:hypothetical protein [Alphaproteobacteria bacterium]
TECNRVNATANIACRYGYDNSYNNTCDNIINYDSSRTGTNNTVTAANSATLTCCKCCELNYLNESTGLVYSSSFTPTGSMTQYISNLCPGTYKIVAKGGGGPCYGNQGAKMWGGTGGYAEAKYTSSGTINFAITTKTGGIRVGYGGAHPFSSAIGASGVGVCLGTSVCTSSSTMLVVAGGGGAGGAAGGGGGGWGGGGGGQWWWFSGNSWSVSGGGKGFVCDGGAGYHGRSYSASYGGSGCSYGGTKIGGDGSKYWTDWGWTNATNATAGTGGGGGGVGTDWGSRNSGGGGEGSGKCFSVSGLSCTKTTVGGGVAGTTGTSEPEAPTVQIYKVN